MDRKRRGDFFTATRELRVRIAPNFDAVCFHAQQRAENYLKAALQEYANAIPRTHSLAELMALCMNIDPVYSEYKLFLSTEKPTTFTTKNRPFGSNCTLKITTKNRPPPTTALQKHDRIGPLMQRIGQRWRAT